MKTNDLLMIGGIGLVAFMLSKSKPAEAKGNGGVTVIPMGDTPLDIGGIFGGIFEGIGSIFGAMPSQVIPEINIPEFKLPDIDISEYPMPDWENFLPDWEMFIPKIPDEGLIPDIPSLIPDISSLIPDIPKISGNGLPSWNIPNLIEKGVTGLISARETTMFSEQWWTDIMPSFVLTEWGQYKREHEAEWETEWTEKGYPETITPEWYYANKAATGGLLPQDILAIRENVTGTPESAALPYPEYEADIALLKKHPYFSKVI